MVKSSHMGINGCSSSSELDARNVLPHQTTIKRKDHHTWKACTCLACCEMFQKLEQQQNKNVSGFSVRLPVHRRAESQRSPGTTGTAGHHKRWRTERQTVTLYLRWITRLKCVNSEVRAVISHHYTRQEWIFVEIRWELNSLTCKFDETNIDLWSSIRILGCTPRGPSRWETDTSRFQKRIPSKNKFRSGSGKRLCK